MQFTLIGDMTMTTGQRLGLSSERIQSIQHLITNLVVDKSFDGDRPDAPLVLKEVLESCEGEVENVYAAFVLGYTLDAFALLKLTKETVVEETEPTAMTDRSILKFERTLADLMALEHKVKRMIADGTLGGNGRHDFLEDIRSDIDKLHETIKLAKGEKK